MLPHPKQHTWRYIVLNPKCISFSSTDTSLQKIRTIKKKCNFYCNVISSTEKTWVSRYLKGKTLALPALTTPCKFQFRMI